MKATHGKSLLACAASALLVLVAGCSSDASEPEEAAVENGAFPRAITHDLGKTEIPEKPVRIAALTATLVDSSVALGVQVVATTDLGLGQDKVPDYLGEDGQKLVGDAEVVGALLEPSLEKIAATKPDLIISQTSRHEKIYDQLTKIAPTVMSGESGVGWKEILRQLAEATGTEKKAEELLSAYDSRAEKIATALKDKLGKAPTAAPIRFTDGATVRLYVSNSFTGSVLEDAGFVLSDEKATDAAGSRIDVGQENLLMLDADYLFVASKGDDAAKRQAEAFKANPLWSRLEGELINVRDDTWMTAVSYSAADAVLADLEKQFGIGG